MSRNQLLRIAAISGALSVVLGAFGAHTLKSLLSPEQLQSYETGVRYQFYHTFAILFCAIMMDKYPVRQLNMAATSFIAGIILFSGSIYLLATRSLTGIDNLSILGPVTPLGGVLFILGWIFVFIAMKKQNPAKDTVQ